MHSLMPRLNLVQMLLLSSGLLPKPLAGVILKYVLIITLAVLIICQSIFNLAFSQDHTHTDCCFRKNLNCSIEESLQRFEKVCKAALEKMVRVRG